MAIRPVEFQILLTLSAEERHGYAIMQEAARLTDSARPIEPGTLYRALHRMLKAGWVAESSRRAPPPSQAGSSGRGPRTEQPGGRGPRSDQPGGRSPRSGDDDPRRRYYKLTALGRRIASAEAERLAQLVGAARANRLLTRA